MTELPAALLRRLRFATRPAVLLLVDFSGVEHADDPRFLATLSAHLEAAVGDAPHEAHGLPGPRLALFAPPDARPALEGAVASLARVLREHGFGEPRASFQDLRQEAAAPAGTLDELSPALEALVGIERAIHHADVASLVREQPICALSPEGERPVPVLSELWIDLTELETRLGLVLHSDQRLLREVTERFDGRMLRHLILDRASSPRRFSVNLHCATVLAPGFAALADEMPRDLRGRVTAELAQVEAGADPRRFVAAVGALRRLGFGVALDLVPLAGLASLDPPAPMDLVKLAWSRRAASEPGAAGDVAAAVSRLGADHVVLCHCDDQEALAFGLASGVRLFQGWGVDARLRAPAAPTQAEVAEPAPEAPKPDQSLLGRLFGRV